jgi:hypothetical protein
MQAKGIKPDTRSKSNPYADGRGNRIPLHAIAAGADGILLQNSAMDSGRQPKDSPGDDIFLDSRKNKDTPAIRGNKSFGILLLSLCCAFLPIRNEYFCRLTFFRDRFDDIGSKFYPSTQPTHLTRST